MGLVPSDSFISSFQGEVAGDSTASAWLHSMPSFFYQYVTDNVFKQLIKHHCSSSEQPHATSCQLPDLTYDETSALRYAAGYVCRAMRKDFHSNPEVYNISGN